MKSFLFLFVALSIFSFKSFAMSKHVQGTITLGPCSVAYNGTITYSLLPPQITGFSGTITFSGNCRGTITINAIAVHQDDAGDITSLDYTVLSSDNDDAMKTYMVNEIDFINELNSIQYQLE